MYAKSSCCGIATMIQSCQIGISRAEVTREDLEPTFWSKGPAVAQCHHFPWLFRFPVAVQQWLISQKKRFLQSAAIHVGAYSRISIRFRTPLFLEGTGVSMQNKG